uniref:Transposon Ty3-I Gag-Pol polyprotein n=1 Tax=Cajanus cajan TaxID=3821 RepID=A0A151T2N2_CAJCA|nr:Transposon Ty3-I Gag-Pol polyprotein [Cajanus cajan]
MRIERKLAVEEEVTKLLGVHFIREVQYTTWLANVVMVKNSNRKWRMCTDYTSLNKACPKDAYPLSNIDRLVDGASGHNVLTFLDAYSGYNQIRMHPRDEEKTAFITDSANYCYRVMPFGLKNAGATYQRLMDKIFRHQLGKNMEVYVDDMVVKSGNLDKHVADLAEEFQQLRKHDMRLNPEKCIFGIVGGKFLGFMLLARGIEANLDKCREVVEMRSP